MTLANKITVSRMLLIPVMVILISIPQLNIETNFLGLYLGHLLFAGLFVVAASTDFLDGYVARKRNEITTFGKFLDPIADKMLTFTALLFLMSIMPDTVPLWSVVIILIREFAVTGVRLLSVQKDTVIAASIYGKIKTILTMLAIVVLLFNNFEIAAIEAVPGIIGTVGGIIYLLAVVATIVSGIDYLIKAKSVIFESV